MVAAAETVEARKAVVLTVKEVAAREAEAVRMALVVCVVRGPQAGARLGVGSVVARAVLDRSCMPCTYNVRNYPGGC